ncbi:hypothetical protein GWI33_015587 [Rhynchophorus ferrugineus]|uniref:Tyrosine-protein kinase receptor n=1 Tax=Rhynchophorus ferrugineus TaxID=354439 RepID=A0A834M5V2_RHYFE|nr:hypothetical protein GWI33_015587 [Rhynchophorus ferrugineus]
MSGDCLEPNAWACFCQQSQRLSAPSGPPLMATAVQARPRGATPGCAIYSFLLLFLLSWSGPTIASELLNPVGETSICKSIDIRNRLDSFKQLDGCQVIEGYLQVILFDNANETEFESISFPDLVEITDYLLLFRVNGLKSVGRLFPNLSVIRGQNLVSETKALVIYEMSSLQEIGLHSLTDIMRGGVHIDKNPSLCFIETVDWFRIIQDQSAQNYIKSLKPENECPVCPASVDGRACPKHENSNKYMCWNRDHCQKICSGCGNSTCNSQDENSYSDKCVTKCPKDFYAYLGRRCVTSDYCINIPRPIDYQLTEHNMVERPYKVFNNSCILKCPTNYADDFANNTCKECDHTCKKECQGARIDSVGLAFKLRGCTHITNSLEIQIRGGNKVVSVLEENLGMIEEINGYLKVVRSYSLVNLNFFKNLKRIRGNFLESQKYSLVVLDNQNLEDLFDWDTHKDFKIDNGTLFFHFNPRLCISKIETLRQKANLKPFTDMEVASTNGDKVACNVTELQVEIMRINSKAAILQWHPFELDDTRKLLRYSIYKKEATTQTVNFYDGRDACGQDNWAVDDVANNQDKDPIQHILTNLKPYTRYAFYIKTYTLASEQNGAQSKIMYFTTQPAQPSIPRHLAITSNSSDSLIIKWRPPAEPNGKITHYIISGIKHETNNQYNRDYCKDGITTTEQKKTTPQTPVAANSPRVCERQPDKIDPTVDEQEQINRINFENELHNRVYVKRLKDPRVRTRRATEYMIDKDSINRTSDTYHPSYEYQSTIENTVENTTEYGTNIWKSFSFYVYGNREEFYIRNLHHYTAYDINIRVCREKIVNDSEQYCSEANSEIGTTMKKVGADKITNVTVSNITFDSVTVLWTQPHDPNGKIVSVNILYKREGNKNAQYIAECIPFQDFPSLSKDNKTLNYTITKLFPGNHSLCLKASSFAEVGEKSDCINFVIPEETSITALIVLAILFILLVMIIGLVYYRKTIRDKHNMRLIPAVNPEYVPSVYIPDEWEVPRKKIELLKELGQGSFGMVWEGIAYDIRGQPSVKCAVKTVNEHATNRERADFLNEASVMKGFDTTHVVRLLGVVSQGQPTLVIMELMAKGDLKSYLRSHRPENNDRKSAPTLKQILQMAVEIADGMAYLEAKKFVHRDLAARNCMVSDDLTVKIGDFGMTRDIYETDYYRKGSKGLLPVRWMAPESLKDGVFSSSSDVWSYGVVLWEMATLASQPYQGLANDQVLRYVIDGGVMERPENCPDKLYELMRHCWDPKPGRRPTFMKLCQLLLPDANERFLTVSFYNSPAGNEARTARASSSASTDNGYVDGDVDDADASTPLNALPPDVRIVSGYGMSVSGRSDSIQSVHLDPNPRFYSISEDRTANGYVGNRVKNGKIVHLNG